ncbi:glycoside hydrolase family 38 C-terminal domain-containing protein [Proteinivorax hydrogeniformans]|uniref:Glycoside hydrolase family 38 C-terminal domain-containing protein n=1 Tax=Proteinivorax hydrogeniformans TaxID=1826727 RepID=A0AAU8HUE3_9FIRM
MESTLKKYICEGRIIPGPWYVQPDTFLPSGESLIRNLLISKHISDSYGTSLNIGYLPDSFGQSSCIPTILNGFDINTVLFYRGIADDDVKHNEFVWRGSGNSEVIAAWMPSGYGNGMFLSEDIEKNVTEVQKNLEFLESRSINGNILLMSGSDQCYPKKHLVKAAKELNSYYKDEQYSFRVSSPEEFFKDLLPFRNQMEVLTGELRKGKHSRVHNSIGATRLDIKRKNYDVERKYENLVEPLNALVSLEKDIKNIDIINRGWRYIVENHAHDSICNVCTDIIHKEMEMRIEYADQIGDYLVDENFQTLHSLINYKDGAGRPIIIYSGFIGETKELIEVDVYSKSKNFTLVDEKGNEVYYIKESCEQINLKDLKVSLTPLPDDYYYKYKVKFIAKSKGIGYKTYYLRESDDKKEIDESLVKANNILENSYIRVEVENNGAITICDKINNKVYKNQHIFRNNGNAGDEYDYSPPYEDYEIRSIDKLKSIKITEDTPITASLEVKYTLKVPKTTNNKVRIKDMVELDLLTVITLTKGIKYVDFKTFIENTAENHRIQVLFKFDEKIDNNFADNQFGEIVRENVFEQTKESEESNWSERYYPIFNQHKFSGLKSNDGTGFIIMNKGLPQYEILQEEVTTLAITLLSSVGYMGNENLKYRKGRRSGAMCATPDAQLLGNRVAEYAFMPINKDLDYHSVAHGYTNKITGISYPEYESQGVWSDCLTVIEGENLLNSTFKCSEDGEGYVVRVFNPTKKTKEAISLSYNRHLFKNIYNINMAEQNIRDHNVKILKTNNPDMSDSPKLSGEIKYSKFVSNDVKSHKFIKS